MKNSSKPRIVFFGTPELAIPTLARLVEDFEVVAVVTRPDRTRGRNRRNLEACPVKEFAQEKNIPVLQPCQHTEEGFREAMVELDADVFCVLAFGMIMPQWLIDTPACGCFNAHTSLLPHLRGAAPINWAIIRGDEKTGVSVQRMVKKLDAGPVVWQRELAIDAKETTASLSEKLAAIIPQAMFETVHAAFDGSLEETIQDEEKVTYAPLLSKETGLIDWSKSAEEIDRLVRGCIPWPVAYTYLQDNYLKIWDCNIIKGVDNDPGEVVACSTKQGIIVACGTDALEIKVCQKQNHKRLDSAAFLCGSKLDVGFRFDSKEKN